MAAATAPSKGPIRPGLASRPTGAGAGRGAAGPLASKPFRPTHGAGPAGPDVGSASTPGSATATPTAISVVPAGRLCGGAEAAIGAGGRRVAGPAAPRGPSATALLIGTGGCPGSKGPGAGPTFVTPGRSTIIGRLTDGARATRPSEGGAFSGGLATTTCCARIASIAGLTRIHASPATQGATSPASARAT